MPAGAITISGGSGKDTISFAFTVTGTNTLRYAQNLANTVDHLIAPTTKGGLGQSITFVDQGALASQGPGADTLTPVFVLVPVEADSAAAFHIDAAGYVIDSIGGAITVDGAVTGGDSVIVAAINSATTFNAQGSGNSVVFVSGNNTYNGTSLDTGNDTIVAGSGFDTIITGQGSNTINSGTGDATITLNDTGSGAFNDHVWLDDGKATVYANGTSDAIIATTEGQTIYGGTNAAGNLAVVLLPNSDGTANGNDLLTAGAGTTTLFDDSSNNSVVGGSGNLYFLGGTGVSADLTMGSGSVYAFDEANSSLSVGGAGTGTVYFVAGSGNETLDGASASATFYVTGGDSTANDVLIGGTGHNVLTAGGGFETLTGGTGTNIYQITDAGSANASLTVSDFLSGTANNLVLDGFSQADITTLLSGGTEANGNYTVTIGSGTTITFDGLTSGSELNGHIITFGNT